MDSLTLEEVASTDFIPSFSQLKDTPKSELDAIWIISATALSLTVWTLKGIISNGLENAKNERAAELEEQKLELAQRDSLIKHLQEQNSKLVNEIFILRRTMDYSGNLTNELKV